MFRRLALVFAVMVASTFSRSDALAEGPQMVITDAIPNLTIPASILIDRTYQRSFNWQCRLR